jgi:hypothetical protein
MGISNLLKLFAYFSKLIPLREDGSIWNFVDAGPNQFQLGWTWFFFGFGNDVELGIC